MPSLQPNPQFTPPARRRGLRDIVGGYRIDRWPIKVDIASGETPESWLRRVSDRYQLTPRQLCDALGIKLAGHPKITAVLKQYSDSVEAALDIRVDDLTTAVDVHFRSLWLASFVASRHRFCPICLEDNGYWRASWRLPLSVICPRHQILYIDRCPDCGEQPWRTEAWLGQCAPVYVCTARVPSEAGPERKVGRWCGADLREASRIPAPETASQAQAILAANEHHLARTSLPSAAYRFGISTRESREVLATLIGAAWTRTQSDQLTTDRRVQALDTGLVAYQEITTTDQPTPQLDQLSDTMRLDRILLGGNDNVGLYGPVIAAWYVDRVREHLSPRKQLGWRTARTWPSLPADPTTPWASADARLPEHRQQPACAPAAWVPQLLDTDTLHLPWEPDPAGRALAAMCLLNLGRGIKWAYIALELGLPARLQHIAAQRLNNSPRPAWQRFVSSLEDTFSQLCQSPPTINYRLRRIIAADPHLVRRCIAQQMGCSLQDIPQDSIAAVWAAYTGGDIHFAPSAIISKPKRHRAKEPGLPDSAVDAAQRLPYAQIFEGLDAAALDPRTHKLQPP